MLNGLPLVFLVTRALALRGTGQTEIQQVQLWGQADGEDTQLKQFLHIMLLLREQEPCSKKKNTAVLQGWSHLKGKRIYLGKGAATDLLFHLSFFVEAVCEQKTF